MPKEYKVIHGDKEPARVAAEATRESTKDGWELLHIIATPQLGQGRDWTGILVRERVAKAK